VRHLKALDEMLLQLADAASALGNQPLRERFLDGRAAVHRGIAFANSLYLSS
jgi:superfamily II RNA helicase